MGVVRNHRQTLKNTLPYLFKEKNVLFAKNIYTNVCIFVFCVYICGRLASKASGKQISNNQNLKQMTSSVITKVLQRVENEPLEYSLGFRRLTSLPKKTRLAFNIAANLKTDWDSAKAHQNQKDFLGALGESEFIEWLKRM